MDYSEDMLDAFEELRYTPAWYYKHFPGFWNLGCYEVLAKHSLQPVEDMQPMQEEEEEDPNKKMKVEPEDTNDGNVCSEQQRGHNESDLELTSEDTQG